EWSYGFSGIKTQFSGVNSMVAGPVDPEDSRFRTATPCGRLSEENSMALKSIRDIDLTRGGFSDPASASSYYPDTIPTTHIHLGVPTSSGGVIAPAGSRWVTFISLKVNDVVVGKLLPDNEGNFHVDRL